MKKIITLKERQEAMKQRRDVVKNNPDMATYELAELLGVSERTIKKDRQMVAGRKIVDSRPPLHLQKSPFKKRETRAATDIFIYNSF